MTRFLFSVPAVCTPAGDCERGEDDPAAAGRRMNAEVGSRCRVCQRPVAVRWHMRFTGADGREAVEELFRRIEALIGATARTYTTGRRF